MKKIQKRSIMHLTIPGVALLSPPARRKRECRERETKRFARWFSNSQANDLSENSSGKVRQKCRASSLEKQRLNCVLRAESAQADCKKSDVNLVGIYASKIIFWRV